MIVVISIWLSSIFMITDYNGSWFNLKLSKISFNSNRTFIILLLIIIQLFIIRKVNKEKEFVPTDIYGNYPIIIYNIAYFILGYKKVNLKMKPIPLQFKLLYENKFDCIVNTEYSANNYKYKVNHIGKLNNKISQINIIISDTYQIKENQLPKSKINNYTIKIDRMGQYGVRTHSQELINLLIKEVQEIKKYCREYNLFLSTPSSINKAIYNEVFQTGQRDGFKLNIYQQDNKNNFKFKEKPITIKC